MHIDEHRAALISCLRAYHQAMVEACTQELAGLLDRDFSLKHITGYVQPMREWFAVISTGQFDYHVITVDEDELKVSIIDREARLCGKGIFDATINGMRASWRLRFQMVFYQRGGQWIIASAQYVSG